MSFVAAEILLAVQDELAAFAIYRKILGPKESGGRDWRKVYSECKVPQTKCPDKLGPKIG
jgi:hypothetical protein